MNVPFIHYYYVCEIHRSTIAPVCVENHNFIMHTAERNKRHQLLKFIRAFLKL